MSEQRPCPDCDPASVRLPRKAVTEQRISPEERERFLKQYAKATLGELLTALESAEARVERLKEALRTICNIGEWRDVEVAEAALSGSVVPAQERAEEVGGE